MNESIGYVSSLQADQERHAIGRKVLYTLYTEDKLGTETIVGRYFDGFTCYNTRGYWRGVAELSVAIEIVATSADKATVYRLAEDIRRTNRQTSVLVTETNIHATFVEASGADYPIATRAHEAAE